LRWSEAFFSSNSFVSSLSLNPVLYFFDTFKFRSVSYDKDVVKKYYPIVSKYLGVKSPDAEKLTFQRDVRPADERLKPPNIVIIVMESLASFKTAASGNAMSATPNIDSLAKKSLYFSNYFSPSEGTARSIFTLLTGIPDVNSHKTSSRNPIIVSQNLIINSFKNHKKFYFIGGSASWGNIRGVLSHNIPDLNLVEEGNFEAPRTDVWGISDYDLFLEANQRLSKLEDDTPFFAIIQTAGYHRPYTIPSKVGSFKLKDITAQQAKDNGYISKEEYNSLRFADFGLGEFIELAKKKPYFDNTLFVIIGDHGLPDEKAKHLKPGVILYSLERWHTPLIFYGPSFFPEPQVLEKPASEIDIMTTVAAFAGIKHTNTTMGRNLFTDTYDSSRYAFLFTYYNNPQE